MVIIRLVHKQTIIYNMCNNVFSSALFVLDVVDNNILGQVCFNTWWAVQ